jgi:RNA polymerase sigma-70 factor (ECF subfamily)
VKHIQNTYFINSLKEQNLEAFSTLYEAYAPAFYGVIKKSLCVSAECEKILQNAFCIIWKSIEEFDPAKERFFTWCLKIVRKEIRKSKVELLLKEIFTCQRTPILKVA